MGENNNVPNNEAVNQAPTPAAVNTAPTEHPTSFLPTKAVLALPKSPEAKMQGIHIEAIHVVIFFLITAILFYSAWKKPGQRN